MERGSATTDQDYTYFTSRDSNTIFSYRMRGDSWKELPRCPHYSSALVLVDSVLTAVGGQEGRYYTNKLVTLRQFRWVEEYPPMSIARSSPAIVSTSEGRHTIVIVIGGEGDGGWTDAVELYNTGRRSWSQLTSLPQSLTLPSAAICGNQLHVIGNDTIGYSCSLQALLSNHRPMESQSRAPMWTPLPRLPVTCSTAATLCGQLVIIGGIRSKGPDKSPVIGKKNRSCIHQLQLYKQWVKIGSLSSGRRECLVASPSPEKMVVVGGGGAVDSVEVCVATCVEN